MESDNSAEKKLFLLDAYALIYRSYFAFIRNPRITSKGLNTSAIFGFVTSLEQVLASESPTHIAVAFDVHGDTFRHEMFPEYKANREVMPEDLQTQIPYIFKACDVLGVTTARVSGFEADDLIGTLARKATEQGIETVIVSNDISNTKLERVQVVPITSKAAKIYLSEAKTTINGIEGKATASQITTVSHQRMIKKLGTLTAIEMQNIDEAIRYQLGL